MALSFHSKALFCSALVLMSACLLPAVKADVTAVNQCSYGLTIFWQSQTQSIAQIALAAGQSAALGIPSTSLGLVVWGSQHANTNNGQCSQLEFTINDPSGRDSYDISLVNAYNEPVEILPTTIAGGDAPNGLECGTITCSIPDLSTVCVMDNYFAGPDNACINGDGTGTVDTPSIDLFRNACPDVYVQSNDNTNVVYGCDSGTDYNAVWCP